MGINYETGPSILLPGPRKLLLESKLLMVLNSPALNRLLVIIFAGERVHYAVSDSSHPN